MTRHRSTARALTLIELLVSVAIIAALIGILFPALSSARANANSLRCQANLRQWAIAATYYAQANDGFLPRRGQGVQVTSNITRPEDWFNALPPMLGQESFAELVQSGRAPRSSDRSIWICVRPEQVTADFYLFYAMNMWLSTSQAAQPDRLDRVAPTHQQVFMAEGPGPFCSVLPASAPYSVIAPHRDNANIAFLDGHAARFAKSFVGCGVGDPLRADVQWRVPGSTWNGPPQ